MMRFRILVIATVVSTVGGTSSLSQSALHFTSCKVGKHDVDVAAFVDATQAYTERLRKFGSFTIGSINQVLACLKKVEDARRTLSDTASPGSRAKRRKALRSMKALLTAELEQGMHGSGGELKDPSAAMGLLWLRRGLAFWARLFELEVERLAANAFESGPPGTLLLQTEQAYAAEVDAFHGWVSRKAFALSMRAAPEWDAMSERGGLPTDGKKRHDELRDWARAINGLLARMKDMHIKLDLEDKRRSI